MKYENTQSYQLHCLTIDADEINLHLLRSMAEDIGLSVQSFQNPLQALQYAEENVVDIVIVDYLLPEMDGVAFIHKFREQFVDVPVVMMSAVSDDESLKLVALKAGATEFLSKPLSAVNFRARIRNLSTLRHAQCQLQNRALSLEEEVAVATRKIFAREMETLGVLSKAAEFKDTDTGNHVRRVAEYSKLIGEQVISDQTELDLLFHAAPLHDLGKVGIPDTILLKPAKLSPEEWKIMKKHTLIGEKILAGCENRVLALGGIIAKTHHERFDGNGYPDGMVGEDIPLMGRIVAIADVFDALTTIRPYKYAWSLEKAMALIKKENGRQFDPVLANIFIGRNHEVRRIFESLQDDLKPAEIMF
jgi:two-component system, response regulator RpfG